jgi:CRISPR system Cascade subunit CasD
MSDEANTVFLRLEGPLQAWGDNSKFVIRRTMEAPTKSGVIGMICCAMGLSRQAVMACPIECPTLRELADRLVLDGRRGDALQLVGTLEMGVRIDRPGVRWWDYHTVGAGIGILRADGKGVKRTSSTGEIETLVTRREYLADASFLVALQGDSELIAEVYGALTDPRWPVYLGRKCCPPAVPVLYRWKDGNGREHGPVLADCQGLRSALKRPPWRARCRGDGTPEELVCLVESPDGEDVWYDTPFSFDPPVHHPRLVNRESLSVGKGKDVSVLNQPMQEHTPPPPRPRADYKTSRFTKKRDDRLDADHGLCVFCKAPAGTVQHVTYRRAGGDESQEDLRSLCRLCHDAVTMIEYGLGMGLDRINPEDPRFRDRIIAKRGEIIAFRSLETRRRRLAPEEVE